MTSKRCPACGVYSPATAEQCDCGQSLAGVGSGTSARASSAIAVAGGVLMALGIALWIFCFAVFDVSVTVPGQTQYSMSERVINVGRVSERQNGIVVGAALFVAGAVLLAGGSRRD